MVPGGNRCSTRLHPIAVAVCSQQTRMASECGPIRSRGRGLNQVKSSGTMRMVCISKTNRYGSPKKSYHIGQ